MLLAARSGLLSLAGPLRLRPLAAGSVVGPGLGSGAHITRGRGGGGEPATVALDQHPHRRRARHGHLDGVRHLEATRSEPAVELGAPRAGQPLLPPPPRRAGPRRRQEARPVQPAWASVTGRGPGNSNRRTGWEAVHVCVDDTTRLAYVFARREPPPIPRAYTPWGNATKVPNGASQSRCPETSSPRVRSSARAGCALVRQYPAVHQQRTAARLVLQDDLGAVLLVRFQGDEEHWWAVPGGGVDGEESLADAARREALEELGVPVVLRDEVWLRTARFTSLNGVAIEQTEHYFRAEIRGNRISPDLDRLREEGVTDVRWWTRAELANTAETVYPAGLADLLAALPDQPVDTSIKIE